MSSSKLKLFQEQISELLLRHRSILDVLSKLNQTNAAVHRTITKAITECGCVQIHGEKQNYTDEFTHEEMKDVVENHLDGDLCEQCVEMTQTELGKHLFYLAALSNSLDLDLDEVLDKESKKCSTLGFFNLS